MNKLPMTAAGHSALEGELKQRIRVERPRLVQRIQEAIADDTNLAENSEYQAARELSHENLVYVRSGIGDVRATPRSSGGDGRKVTPRSSLKPTNFWKKVPEKKANLISTLTRSRRLDDANLRPP